MYMACLALSVKRKVNAELTNGNKNYTTKELSKRERKSAFMFDLGLDFLLSFPQHPEQKDTLFSRKSFGVINAGDLQL